MAGGGVGGGGGGYGDVDRCSVCSGGRRNAAML